MRGRVVAAFAAGFAIGALVLVAALWGTGSLKSAPLPPWHRTNGGRRASRSGRPRHERDGASCPAPPVPPPEGRPPAARRCGAAPRTARRDDSRDASARAGLHLAMPIANVDPKTLTDTFNDARTGHKHEALDILAPRGTPVLAVAEGNVAKLFNSKQGGLTVYQFDNTQQYAFYYAHLDRYAPGSERRHAAAQG